MTEKKDEPVWLTKAEAAAYLDVHPETVRRMADKGSIQRYGSMKKQRFRKDELERYLRTYEPWKLP